MQQDTMTFDDIIDAIFGRMAVRYGAEWLRKWEGVDMAAVKADWKHELKGFSSNLEPLRYALKHLPVKCPTVAEFRSVANSCPPPEFKQLPAPHAKPELAKQVVGAVKQKLSGLPVKDPKQWARNIMAQVEAGKNVPSYRVREARIALGKEGAQAWQ